MNNNVIAFPKLSAILEADAQPVTKKKKPAKAGKKDSMPWEGEKSSMPRGGEDVGEFSSDKPTGNVRKLSKDTDVKAGPSRVWILDKDGKPQKVPPHSPVAKKFLSNPENVKKLQQVMGAGDKVKNISSAKPKAKEEPKADKQPAKKDDVKSAAAAKQPDAKPVAASSPDKAKPAEQPKKKPGKPPAKKNPKSATTLKTAPTSSTSAPPTSAKQGPEQDSDLDAALGALDKPASGKATPPAFPKGFKSKTPQSARLHGIPSSQPQKEPAQPAPPAAPGKPEPSAQVKADKEKLPSLGSLASRDGVKPADIERGPPDLSLTQLYKTVNKTVKDIDDHDPENYPDFAKLARSDLMRKSNFKVQTKQDMDALNLTTLAQAAGLKSKNADDYLQGVYRDKVLGVTEEEPPANQGKTLPKLSTAKK